MGIDLTKLPISEREYKYIMEKVKDNKDLYSKLWTYLFKIKHQGDKI